MVPRWFYQGSTRFCKGGFHQGFIRVAPESCTRVPAGFARAAGCLGWFHQVVQGLRVVAEVRFHKGSTRVPSARVCSWAEH